MVIMHRICIFKSLLIWKEKLVIILEFVVKKHLLFMKIIVQTLIYY